MSIAQLGIVPDSPADRGYGGDRTPPHDVLAEQSTLGGMLLSKDAVADVIEVVRGRDFYLPKHEIIFDALLNLYSHGEPTDVITVSEELTKTGICLVLVALTTCTQSCLWSPRQQAPGITPPSWLTKLSFVAL